MAKKWAYMRVYKITLIVSVKTRPTNLSSPNVCLMELVLYILRIELKLSTNRAYFQASDIFVFHLHVLGSIFGDHNKVALCWGFQGYGRNC